MNAALEKYMAFSACALLALAFTVPGTAAEPGPAEANAASPNESPATRIPLGLPPTEAFINGKKYEIPNTHMVIVIPIGWECKPTKKNVVALGAKNINETLIKIRAYERQPINTPKEVAEHLARDFTDSGIMEIKHEKKITLAGKDAWAFFLSCRTLRGRSWDSLNVYPKPRRRIGLELRFSLPMDMDFIGEFLDNIEYLPLPERTPKEVLKVEINLPEWLQTYDTLVDNRLAWTSGDPNNPDVLVVGEILEYPMEASASQAFKTAMDILLDDTKGPKVKVVSAKSIDRLDIKGCETRGMVVELNTDPNDPKSSDPKSSMRVILLVAVPPHSTRAHLFRAYFESDGLKHFDEVLAALSSFRSLLTSATGEETGKTVEKKDKAADEAVEKTASPKAKAQTKPSLKPDKARENNTSPTPDVLDLPGESPDDPLF